MASIIILQFIAAVPVPTTGINKAPFNVVVRTRNSGVELLLCRLCTAFPTEGIFGADSRRSFAGGNKIQIDPPAVLCLNQHWQPSFCRSVGDVVVYFYFFYVCHLCLTNQRSILIITILLQKI